MYFIGTPYFLDGPLTLANIDYAASTMAMTYNRLPTEIDSKNVEIGDRVMDG